MRYVPTGQLQNSLPAKRMFKGFFARRTLAAYEGAFPPRFTALCREHAVAMLLELGQRRQPGVVAPLRLLLISIRGGCLPDCCL